MADEARPGRAQAHELALARLQRQREAGGGGERRRPGAGGEHDRARGQPSPARAQAAHRAARHLDRFDRAFRADHGAGRGRLADERVRDRARVALQVAGHVRGAEHGAGQRGLEPPQLRGIDERGRHAEPGDPRGLGGPGGGVRVDHEGALAADPRLPAQPLLQLVVHAQARAGELELGPGVLVAGQHVPLPPPRRARGHLPAVEQRDGDAADGELARDRGADDAGADDGDVRARDHAAAARAGVTARSRPGRGRRRRAGTGPCR